MVGNRDGTAAAARRTAKRAVLRSRLSSYFAHFEPDAADSEEGVTEQEPCARVVDSESDTPTAKNDNSGSARGDSLPEKAKEIDCDKMADARCRINKSEQRQFYFGPFKVLPLFQKMCEEALNVFTGFFQKRLIRRMIGQQMRKLE